MTLSNLLYIYDLSNLLYIYDLSNLLYIYDLSNLHLYHQTQSFNLQSRTICMINVLVSLRRCRGRSLAIELLSLREEPFLNRKLEGQPKAQLFLLFGYFLRNSRKILCMVELHRVLS